MIEGSKLLMISILIAELTCGECFWVYHVFDIVDAIYNEAWYDKLAIMLPERADCGFSAKLNKLVNRPTLLLRFERLSILNNSVQFAIIMLMWGVQLSKLKVMLNAPQIESLKQLMPNDKGEHNQNKVLHLYYYKLIILIYCQISQLNWTKLSKHSSYMSIIFIVVSVGSFILLCFPPIGQFFL